jgi:hypothetical protein
MRYHLWKRMSVKRNTISYYDEMSEQKKRNDKWNQLNNKIKHYNVRGQFPTGKIREFVRARFINWAKYEQRNPMLKNWSLEYMSQSILLESSSLTNPKFQGHSKSYRSIIGGKEPSFQSHHKKLIILKNSFRQRVPAILKLCSYHETASQTRVVLLTCLLTYGDRPFFRICQLCRYSRTSQHFMELEGSLPCSQQPSTGPYPKPDRSKSKPSHPIPLRTILILSTHLRLGLPSGLLPSGFPTNIIYAFLFVLIRGNNIYFLFIFFPTYKKETADNIKLNFLTPSWSLCLESHKQVIL